MDFMRVVMVVLLLFAFFLNVLGLMKLIPLYLTLPLFFLSIYLTVNAFANRKMYRRMR